MRLHHIAIAHQSIYVAVRINVNECYCHRITGACRERACAHAREGGHAVAIVAQKPIRSPVVHEGNVQVAICIRVGERHTDEAS